MNSWVIKLSKDQIIGLILGLVFVFPAIFQVAGVESLTQTARLTYAQLTASNQLLEEYTNKYIEARLTNLKSRSDVVMEEESKNLGILESSNTVSSNSSPDSQLPIFSDSASGSVLGASISTSDFIDSFRAVIAQGLPDDILAQFRGPRGETGDKGETTYVTGPPQYSVGYTVPQAQSPGTVLGATSIGAKEITVNNLTVTSQLITNSLTPASFGGSVSFGGNTTIGDASSDTVTFNSRLASHIIPATDDAYDLGSVTNRFRNLYVGPGTIHVICDSSECASAQEYRLSVDSATGKLQITDDSANTFFTVDTSGKSIASKQLQAIVSPTLPHVFSSFPTGTSNVSDSTLYINPATAVADSNLLGLAVNGTVKFLVDAEGDIYGNNLILTGSTSTGATTIAGNLTVQDSTTLGDATTDTVSITGNLGIGTTSPGAKLSVVGGGFRSEEHIISRSNASILSSKSGFTGYTNFSGGIGTGGVDSVASALRLTSTGNLVNIGSIQAGELNLTKGGTLAAKVNYSVGAASRPLDVALGDVNNDGKADMVVTNQDEAKVAVFINNGDGTFVARVDYAVGTGVFGVALADFNGDGKNDITVANQTAASISVLLNNGNGTFATKVDYSTGGSNPRYIAAADLNNDGKPDITTPNGSSNNVAVFMNNGDGTFAAAVAYATGTSPFGVALADLNGDGKTDIAVENYTDSTASVLINNGDGTFATKVDYATGTNPKDIALGDVNGDGKGDMVLTNGTSSDVSVLLNNGNGTFATAVSYSAGGNVWGVALGDVSGDGKNDIIVSGVPNSLCFYFN